MENKEFYDISNTSKNHINRASIDFLQYDRTEYVLNQDIDFSDIEQRINLALSNWFMVSGMSDTTKISSIMNSFNLHNIDRKDIYRSGKYASLNAYDDKLILRMNGVRFSSDGEILSSGISFVLGSNYLVTFTDDDNGLFSEISEAIKGGAVNLTKKGCDYLFITLLNRLIDQYKKVITRIEQNLESYTCMAIATDEPTDIMANVVNDRKAYISLKHETTSVNDAISKLLHEQDELIADKNLIYIDDILRQLQFIIHDIESCDQAFNSIVNLHFNNNSKRMNDVMKRLTVISTIFSPMTFLAGVWGMNFSNMPETNTNYGYFIALGVLCISALSSWYFLKKKRWL